MDKTLAKLGGVAQIEVMGGTSSEILHPPKPRFTLRVGITGHGPTKLSGSRLQSTKLTFTRVFSAIEQTANEILRANAAIYANEPPQFRLVSGFPDEIDQATILACSNAWLIEVILPFQKDGYFKDPSNAPAESLKSLKNVSSVTELPSQKPHGRGQGHINADSYLLRQIDLLIVVWDDSPPKSGRIGAIAREANQGGIPVIWLSPAIDFSPRLITGFDDKGEPIPSDVDCTEGPLISALRPIFDGPSLDPGQFNRVPQDALIGFYRETWRSHCYFTVYDFLTRVALIRKPRAVICPRPFLDQCSDWDTFFHSAPSADNLVERIRQVLLPRFVWADNLAIYFSHHYRSAYILAYLLSAVAVFIGLGGAYAVNIDQEVAFLFSEFIVVGLIITLIFLGRHWFWHERWLDYRALAESLRHGRFLAFVSEFGRIHDGSSGMISRMPLWTLWYIRATMRELGLPSAVLDSTYQWRILDATLVFEIEEQIKYHQRNRLIVHRIDRLLHGTGVFCFLVTFVILMIFLAGFVEEYYFGAMQVAGGKTSTALGYVAYVLRPRMLFFTAGLPALGAALAGIRVHGDFESSEQRSALMIDSLTSLKVDYESTMAGEVGDLDDTAESLIAASRVMSEDLAAWEELYGRKRLVLPA
jgi:hypothetical protein